MLSCHEWIIDVGILSCYGKMMKMEMVKDELLEETYRAKEIILSPGENTKERQAIKEDEEQGHMEDFSYLIHKEQEKVEHVSYFQEYTNK